MLQPNQPLDLPNYRVIDCLHASSKTLVYRAQRIFDGQSVILKLLRSESPRFDELLQFRNQYTITKNLNISGIIQPLGLEIYKNSYVLIMEDSGGVSLKQYANNHPLSLVDILNIAIQLAEILHEIHQSRIIHKDVKPANIIIHPQSQQVKLIDFSIASLLPKETQEIQNPNILEGTIAYLSPEQTGRMNRGIDYRTDFYSFGITLYELLTGELPFKSHDLMELVHCHIAKFPTFPHTQSPHESPPHPIPFTLEKIILKLIAKNAEDRYQSALGLKYDLEKCLNQWKHSGTITNFKLGQRDLSSRFLIPEKLYGRESEVQALLNAFDRVSGQTSEKHHKGHSRSVLPCTCNVTTTDEQEEIPPQSSCLRTGGSEMMLVAGFSGIGKTAVIHEVHKPITRQRGYFIKGKFDQFNRGIPLSAFVQALQDLIRQLLSENDIQLQQWKNKILEVVGDQGQVLIDVIPELEIVIGSQQPVAELEGTAAQNRFNLLFQNFIKVFTTVEHPLVIFLDDLQWADLASLELIKLLMNDSRHLLLLGAYRDNEVSPVHPLMMTVEELKTAGEIVNTITLKALKKNEINSLVADTLNCSLEIAQPFSQLIYQKTKGNPFFTTQFLKALYEEGQIEFNHERRYWECDIAQINSLSITDDVVEFMALQLQKLPSQTQDILKLAACMGNQFHLNTLAMVSEQSFTDTATALWNALQEGLILPTTQVYKFFQDAAPSHVENLVNPQYRFLHDRVQQAAYSLIPEEQKQATHLHIGQLLLKNSSELEREEKRFDIVGHLNLATELITQTEEREALARLNLAAAEKARNATAYASAMGFVQVGLQLLRANCWQTQYELTLNLHVAAAEIAYLNGDFENMEKVAATVLQQAETILAKVKIYQIQISALTSQSQMSEAIAMGENVLKQLGVEFSSEADEALTGKALHTLSQQLQGKAIEELTDLPVMSDPQMIAAMQLLAMLFAPIFMAKPALLPLLCSIMVSLSMQFGNTSASAIGYVGYGIVLSSFLAETAKGYRFGQIALNLLDRFNAREFKSTTLLIFGGFIQHRQEALRTTIPTLKEGYLVGMETGNFQYAGYCISKYLYDHYFAGVDLEDWKPQIENYCVVLTQVKQYSNLAYLKLTQQVVHHLTEIVNQPDVFSGSDYDETVMFPKHHQDNELTILAFAYIYKVILAYLFGNYTKALDYIAEAQLYLIATGGAVFTPVFYFYAGLTYLALYSTQSEIEQENTMALVASHQTSLAEWAAHAPMNHQHKYDLVEAEYYRVLEKKSEAIEYYDRAIAGAKENKFIQEEALANELAAQFYLSWGKEKIAQEYLTNAYYCYSRWGATAKVKDLEKRYPQLLAPILQQQPITLSTTETVFTTLGLTSLQTFVTQSSSSSSTGISALLDLETVLKASQALSSEIELDKLLAIVLKIVLENAGADKGVLLMPHEDKWFVEAVANINQPVQVKSTLFYESSEIPQTLINQVKRNIESVIISDTTANPSLLSDPYIIQQQPKSILCSPILRQDKIVAILYIENHITVDAFTYHRIKLLDIICTQAAISIENAKLYSQIQDNQHRMKRVFNNIPGMAYSCANDEHWTMDFVSEGCYDLTGYRQEEFIKNHTIAYADLIHPDDVEMIDMTVTDAVKNNHPFEFSYRIYTKAAQEKWVWEKGQPVFDETGNLLRLEGLALDITDRKVAEAALVESESYHRQLFDSCSIGLALCRMNGELVYSNAAYCNILGRTSAELPLLSYWDITPIKYAEAEQFQLQSLEQTGRYGPYEKEYFHKDGHLIPVRLSGILVERNGEKFIWSNVEDISDHKAAESQLRENEQFLRSIYEGASQGICVIDVTESGDFRYTGWNPLLDHLTGIQSQDVMGKTPEELLGNAPGSILRKNYQRCLTERTTISYEELVTFQGKEIWWLTTLGPVRNEANQIYRIVLTTIDITDRKTAEFKLHEKEQFLRSIYEGVSQGIGVIDITESGDFKYVGWNPTLEKLTNLPTHAVEGKMLEEIFSETQSSIFRKNYQRCIAERSPISHEEIVPFQGEDMWWLTTLTPVENQANQIHRIILTTINITERKVAEKLLEENNEALENALIQLKQSQAQVIQSEKMSALGNLVAGVAHEINNPLGFLNGSIKNAKDYIHDLFEHLELYQQYHPDTATPVLENADEIDLEFLQEDLPVLLESMQKATDRIKGISTSLRTFSRSDTEHKVSANVNDGIDSTLLILKYRLKASEYRPAIEVIQDYAELPLINCFPGQLNQVFMNILANGIDMFDEMAQSLTLAELKEQPQMMMIQTQKIEKNTIKISISDNGKGMPETVRSRIFDHLFTTKGVGKGTGLGLAIAHQIIVEKHGGQLICNSAVGKGTEFIIQLPIQSE